MISEASTFAQIMNNLDTEISVPLNGKHSVRDLDGRTDTLLNHVVFSEPWGLSFAKLACFLRSTTRVLREKKLGWTFGTEDYQAKEIWL
jgi:hypothetical protein